MKAKEKEGLIKLKVVGKGEPSVVSINLNHTLLLSFVPHKPKPPRPAVAHTTASASSSSASSSSATTATSAQEPEPTFEVIELLKPNSGLLPIFEGSTYAAA
jgi:hypothetical protein